MRSYPRNSPEAVARIIALLLISDGHVSRSELDAL
ncbi:MAG: TerB family tellurite resistance protein, partial [Acidovorax sp.]|nr:TerB family tellurite resistance protein [Acidovorax sp.]MDH4418224.1 TerB family tellurite resistance protein [Acidovorax sp.]